MNDTTKLLDHLRLRLRHTDGRPDDDPLMTYYAPDKLSLTIAEVRQAVEEIERMQQQLAAEREVRIKAERFRDDLINSLAWREQLIGAATKERDDMLSDINVESVAVAMKTDALKQQLASQRTSWEAETAQMLAGFKAHQEALSNELDRANKALEAAEQERSDINVQLVATAMRFNAAEKELELVAFLGDTQAATVREIREVLGIAPEGVDVVEAARQLKRQLAACEASKQWKLVSGIDGPAMVDRERQELRQQLAAMTAERDEIKKRYEYAHEVLDELSSIKRGELSVGGRIDQLIYQQSKATAERNDANVKLACEEGARRQLTERLRKTESESAVMRKVLYNISGNLGRGSMHPSECDALRELAGETYHNTSAGRELLAELDGLRSKVAELEAERDAATKKRDALRERLSEESNRTSACVEMAAEHRDKRELAEGERDAALAELSALRAARPGVADERLKPTGLSLEEASADLDRISRPTTEESKPLPFDPDDYPIEEQAKNPEPPAAAMPTGQPIEIYDGAIVLTVEQKSDGLIRLSFDNGLGHPMTWDLTPAEAAALRRELPDNPAVHSAAEQQLKLKQQLAGFAEQLAAATQRAEVAERELSAGRASLRKIRELNSDLIASNRQLINDAKEAEQQLAAMTSLRNEKADELVKMTKERDEAKEEIERLSEAVLERNVALADKRMRDTAKELRVVDGRPGVPVEVCERFIKRCIDDDSGFHVATADLKWFKRQVKAAKSVCHVVSVKTPDASALQRIRSQMESVASVRPLEIAEAPSEPEADDDGAHLINRVVIEMCGIITDQKADADERKMALHALMEAVEPRDGGNKGLELVANGFCAEIIDLKAERDQLRAELDQLRRDHSTLARAKFGELVTCGQVAEYRRVATEEAKLRKSAEAELDRLKKAFASEGSEIEQILGKALGYAPLYPHASEVDDGQVSVGDHTPVTIAMEAAGRLTAAEAELARIRGALAAINATSLFHWLKGRGWKHDRRTGLWSKGENAYHKEVAIASEVAAIVAPREETVAEQAQDEAKSHRKLITEFAAAVTEADLTTDQLRRMAVIANEANEKGAPSE